MTEIFNELWEIDQANNGLCVSARMEDGCWNNPSADIFIDEQNKYTRGEDQAPNPLFFNVNEEKLNSKTYQAFINLLDNYLINPIDREDDLYSNQQELEEINAFLDAILATPVMNKAYEYINQDLNFSIEPENFKSELIKIWFELYNNYYNDYEVLDCSGFEHVFVGEGSSKSSTGIGGYHYWLKFFLDEVNGRVDFKGYNYYKSQQPEAGSKNPYVVTLSMDWVTNDSRNGLVVRSKDQGGFFVGISPEGQMAIATVLYYKSLKENTIFLAGTRLPCVINGHEYELVMYRETTQNGVNNNGFHIRSFYPKYVKPETQIYTGDGQQGMIKITKALINPSGHDLGNEWFELANQSKERVDLTGWKVVNKLEESYDLHGSIDPNKSLIVYPVSNSFKMTNKNGIIKLINKKEEVITQVEYEKVQKNEILYFN